MIADLNAAAGTRLAAELGPKVRFASVDVTPLIEGDVHIEIDDKASLSNSSNRSRTGSTQAGINHFFGLEGALGRVLPGGFDPANMVDTNSQSDQTGTGAIDRQEKIRPVLLQIFQLHLMIPF